MVTHTDVEGIPISRWQGDFVGKRLPVTASKVRIGGDLHIGDAAAVLFTAGYTDNMPTSIMQPVASLPLAVFFQLGTPFPAVQARAYASALVLTVLILAISVTAHLLLRKVGRYVVR